MKKNLKGMTLYEMIISIAIFAIMAGVLIGVGAHIDNTTRAANNLKKKIATESPYAANKITENFVTHEKFDSDSIDVVVSVKEPANMPAAVYILDPVTGDDKLYNCTYPKDVVLPGQKYKTESAFTGSKSVTVDPNSPNGKLNLEFITYDPAVTTVTATPPTPPTTTTT